MKQMDLRPLASADSRIVLAGPGRAVEMSRCERWPARPVADTRSIPHAQLMNLKERLERSDIECAAAASELYQPGAFSVADPQGRRVAFGVSALDKAASGAPGRLQHTRLPDD